MKRRAFIAALGGAAAWPVVGRAQQRSGLRKVGVLFPGVLGGERERLLTEGLARELGAEKVVLLVRSAQGKSELLGKLAELVVDHVDVIFAVASGSLEAARHASQSIPIVARVPAMSRYRCSMSRFEDAEALQAKLIQCLPQSKWVALKDNTRKTRKPLPQVSKVALLYDLHPCRRHRRLSP